MQKFFDWDLSWKSERYIFAENWASSSTKIQYYLGFPAFSYSGNHSDILQKVFFLGSFCAGWNWISEKIINKKMEKFRYKQLIIYFLKRFKKVFLSSPTKTTSPSQNLKTHILFRLRKVQKTGILSKKTPFMKAAVFIEKGLVFDIKEKECINEDLEICKKNYRQSDSNSPPLAS